MKKLLIMALLACMISIQASAQEVMKEIEKNAKAIKADASKDLTTRRIAAFKVDEITYLRTKVGPQILAAVNRKDTVTYNKLIKMLNEQSYAMYEYINLFFKRLDDSKKKNRGMVVYFFSQTSIENSLFNDMDKELVLAWYNRADYPIPFSLDTNWKKALKIIRAMDWSNK